MYDVIIIGGGLSGLTAAAALAKRKKKVAVFEQHLTVGGLAAGFWRKGYYFDSAMSRINRATILSPIKKLDIVKDVELKRHRSAWKIKEHCFDYRSLDTFFNELARIFVSEEAGIRAFYNEQIKAREKVFEKIMGGAFEENPQSGNILKLLGFLKIMPGLMKDMASKAKANDILKQYLDENGEAYSFLSVREDELNYRGQMNLFMFVGKWYSQLLNVYPVNGFQGIADSIASCVRSMGGEIFTSAHVTKLLIDDGRCTGIEVIRHGNTENVYAANVISAIDLRKALFNLAGEEHIDASLAERLKKSRLAAAIPILYLGLNVPKEKIRCCFNGNEELFYVPAIKKISYDPGSMDFYRDSRMTVHSSCLLNSLHAPENKSNIQVYLQSPLKGWMNNWGIVDGKRTEEYRDIKKIVIEQLLSSLENVIPDLKDRSVIEVCELGTPYTIERYTGNTDGSGCGFTMDEDHINKRRMGKFFESYPGIENLYFAGHQTGYPGAAGTALMSGYNIAKRIN